MINSSQIHKIETILLKSKHLGGEMWEDSNGNPRCSIDPLCSTDAMTVLKTIGKWCEDKPIDKKSVNWRVELYGDRSVDMCGV